MTEYDKTARLDELTDKDELTEDEQTELAALTAEFAPPPAEAQAVTPSRRRRKTKGDDEAATAAGVRYAAFNKSLGRYEGPVRDTRADAEAAAEKASQDGRYDVEVREVK